MLNSKQRAYLRGCANKMDPIFQVGKGGVGDAMVKSLSDALDARELIKISVLENASVTARGVADEIASKTGADVAGVIGRRIILYRESPKEENRSYSLEIRGLNGKKRTVGK
ncbi:MAG: YhbY family RNA-binding protein [Clostridia bacterium]|nr:YhbY family RNA-binding protein [Clostridia bacterium]